MPAIYNEIEPFAAAWLENLAAAGHIAPGIVDRRSIKEIEPDDIREAQQFHAFAGIGVWSYALKLAGWPPARPVWTGSCPCQPFSVAGKRRGKKDDRHLWPSWFRLIRECRPSIIFGEQVGAKLGMDWIGSVSDDLESEGYAVAVADLCAASVGAPHRRQRLFFVADSEYHDRRTDEPIREEERRAAHGRDSARCGSMADSDFQRSQRRIERRNRSDKWPVRPDGLDHWRSVEWLECSDGKTRPTQPGLHPLVNGNPGRVGKLRAYGNAIVPQLAAAFIRSAVEAIEEIRP